MEQFRYYKTTWEGKDTYEVLYHFADNLKEAKDIARIFGKERKFKGKRKTVYFPEYYQMIEDLKKKLWHPSRW